MEISLVENIQRSTRDPLEEGRAFKMYGSDFGWGGISDLAQRIGKSTSYVTKRIKLLNLPPEVLESITSHRINASIAEELLPIKDKDKQSSLANLISERRLSVRMTRKLVKNLDERDTGFYQPSAYSDKYEDHIKLAQWSFDKTISAIRIAMNSLREVIDTVEDDWILYEILMQHKNMLHGQIDILLRQKRKL